MTAAGRIPVLVVGGFLGSGKTSLLRQMLTAVPDTAVIVNEFGAVGLDHDLLRACEERVGLVGGGCACCTKREDLIGMLRELLDDRDRGRAQLSRVVIETSGLADPAPIVFTITNDPMLRHHFEVERLVVTFDAVNGSAQLATHPEVAKQVLVADDLVITKVDLVDASACRAVASQLAGLNPAASIRTALHGVLGEQQLHAARADHHARLAAADHHARLAAADQEVPRAGHTHHTGDAHHTDDVRSLVVAPDEPVDWLGFAIWLSMLLHARGEQVLRVKGLLELDDGTLVSVNGVQHVVHTPEHIARASIPDPTPSVVFITRGLDVGRLRESLEVFQQRAHAGANGQRR
jgi:G3E family GTPase